MSADACAAVPFHPSVNVSDIHLLVSGSDILP